MDSIPHPWERALAAWTRARPLDWTSSFERTVWALTLRDRIFDLYAEALGMAGVGAIAGWREPIYFQPPWRALVPPTVTDGGLGEEGETFAPWPPLEWESPGDRERWYWRLDGRCLDLCSSVIITNLLARVRTWRLACRGHYVRTGQGEVLRLCEYLAALVVRGYPEAEQSEERMCVQWAESRLRSLLVKARRGWPWATRSGARGTVC